MRKLAAGLLSCAYIFAALAVAALVWRGGAGWGAGFSALAGALGFAFALHALIGRSLDSASLRRELESLRDAHRILVDHIESVQEAMEALGETVQANRPNARRPSSRKCGCWKTSWPRWART